MVGSYRRIFYKGVGKEYSLAQSQRKNSKIQIGSLSKEFPNFIYGNPISTKVSGQDEETKARPNGIAQEEEVETEDP